MGHCTCRTDVPNLPRRAGSFAVAAPAPVPTAGRRGARSSPSPGSRVGGPRREGRAAGGCDRVRIRLRSASARPSRASAGNPAARPRRRRPRRSGSLRGRGGRCGHGRVRFPGRSVRKRRRRRAGLAPHRWGATGVPPARGTGRRAAPLGRLRRRGSVRVRKPAPRARAGQGWQRPRGVAGRPGSGRSGRRTRRAPPSYPGRACRARRPPSYSARARDSRRWPSPSGRARSPRGPGRRGTRSVPLRDPPREAIVVRRSS